MVNTGSSENLRAWIGAAAAILCLALSCDAAGAPQDERDTRDADVAALDLDEPDGWELEFDPFAWLAGIDGPIEIGGGSVDVDAGFGDTIFDDLDMFAMFGVEGRRDRFLVFGNFYYMDLGNDESPDSALLDEVDIGTFLSDVELNIPTPQPPGFLPPPIEAIVQQLISDEVMEVTQEVVDALEGVTLGPRLDKVDWNLKLTMIEFALGYRLGEWELGGADRPETEPGAVYMMQSDPFASPAWPVLSVDLYGGARYWDVDTELRFDITPGVLGIVPSRVTKKGSSEWVDPLVGVRMDVAFSEDFRLMLRGDLAGFGVGSGSDLTWNVEALFSWQVTDRMSITAGYHILDLDYSKGSGADRIDLDIKFLGPSIGASFVF